MCCSTERTAKRYKPIDIDFDIPEELQETIKLLLVELNEHNGRSADCYEAEIRSILNCCSIDEELTETQIEVLRRYYCKGGIYAPNNGCQ